MSGHTPGPWIAVGAWVEHPDDDVADICSCDPATINQGHLGRGYSEICANARLIAAAPAMRAEIKRLTKQNAAYRTLNSAQSKQLEFHRSKDAEYQEAIATIDSERAANGMLTAERDAAIANASALTQHLTRVIGDHCAPSDCFSSGPMFGDPRDAICPACAALHFLSNPRASVDSGRDAAISAAVAAEREEHAAEIDRLRAQVKRLRDALVGVVADDDVNSLRFTAAVLESMDCDDATGSLAAVRALIDIRPEGSAGEEKP